MPCQGIVSEARVVCFWMTGFRAVRFYRARRKRQGAARFIVVVPKRQAWELVLDGGGRAAVVDVGETGAPVSDSRLCKAAWEFVF